MSGYAGIVSIEGEIPDSHLLERMAARLAFRGPDATHIWSRPGAGFCFTFLRTGPAPQASQQPCTLDGRVWLLGDIRLDGRDEVIRRLEQVGESLEASVTDEELVLREWRRRGEDCLPDLLGDFAFALWDEQERALWCVRDLMGVRPFFYAQAGGRFYFSNTLDVLRLAGDISSALDPVFIGDFLLQDSCADPARTAFRDISRLPAGHVLHHKNASPGVRSYASLPIEEPLQLKNPQEYVERFRKLLEDAVRDRMSPGPTAVLMSGGLDSTSVAAIASRLAEAQGIRGAIRAYTVDYRGLFDDEEGQHALLAAEHLGIPIEIFSGAKCVPFEGWERLGSLMAEPTNSPFLLLNQEQYLRVQRHSRVVLGGLGGDDLLTGQAWPYLVYLLRRGRLEEVLKRFGGYVLKHGKLPPLQGGFRTRLRRLYRRNESTANYPPWLASEFERSQRLREKWGKLQQLKKSAHPLYPLGHGALSSHAWTPAFEAEDCAATGVPVELRSPFFDRRLLQYLLRVPPVPWCAHKQLLREAMRHILPEAIRLRPKAPLAVDPLVLSVERGAWRPVLPVKPAAEILGFLSWEGLSATLASTRGSKLWIHVRGVSLNYWLESR